MKKVIRKLLKTLGIFLFIVIMTLAFYNSIMFGIKLMSYRQEAITPDIKGAKVQDALRILQAKRHGMILLEEQFNDFMPQGRILKQFPSPGIKLKVDRNVSVIISKGKESIKTPDLIGKSIKSAEFALERFSLEKGNTAFVPSANVKKDHVISQNPAPGILVYKGDEIELLVSDGSEERFFVMPDLIGENLGKALNRLKSLRLSLNRIVYKYNEFFPENIVIDQSPELGYPVSDAVGITLTVNQKVVKQKEENKAVIFGFVLPRGHEKKRLKLVLVDNFMKSRTLKQGVYPAGFYFKHLVYAPKDSEIQLYMDGEIAKRTPVK